MDLRAFIEPIAFAIVLVWLVLRFRVERREDRAKLARELLIIAAAAWIGEATCVRLYKFYAYASVWRVFLDVVPLAVVSIWPIVIKSAMDLCASLRPSAVRTSAVPFALGAAALVTIDASLMEPIAVHTGLWWWTEPGPFDVPVIGVLGWGFFAVWVVLFAGRAADGRVPLKAIVLAPLLMHATLLLSWWLAFKWLPRMTEELFFVAAAVVGSLVAAALLVMRKPDVSRVHVWVRAPAAGFFFSLLAVFCRDDLELVAYALAFAPPWLVLSFSRARGPA